MKYIKKIIVLLILVIISGTPLTASALDSGLIAETLPEDQYSSIYNNSTNNLKKITSYTPQAVKCFDVREDHMIVIGTATGNNAMIAVYDSIGNFQYGFETIVYGDFFVMWSGYDIACYTVRGNLLFIVNKDGKIIDIKKVASNKETSKYQWDVLEATTRTVDTTTYRMTNGTIADFFSSSYKKITKTDAEGTTVIYDASRNWRSRIIWGVIAFLLLSSFMVYGIVDGIKKHCEKMKHLQGDKGTALPSPEEKDNFQS